MNIVLHIAYDGTRFLGWQKTNQEEVAPSIEYTLEMVLEKLLQHKVALQAAGRTDRGVHAEGQVVNFITPKEGLDLLKLAHSLNCLLPDDIRCRLIEEAPDPTFHATLSAKKKQYLYRLYAGDVLPPFLRFTHWHIKERLDRQKMRLAARLLEGTHDFKALRNFRKGKEYSDTVRNLHSIEFEDLNPQILLITLTADNFLYKMARNITGLLVYVGLGKIEAEAVPELLSGTRSDGAVTAPAHGLSLFKVFYS